MHSLFVKILISFWGGLTIFAGLSFWVTSHYLESIRSESNQSHPWVNIRNYVAQAQAIARTKDIKVLRAWLTELDARDVIPYLLIDQDGKDLLGRRVPLRLQYRIRRYEQHRDHGSHMQERERRHRMHRRTIVMGDSRYTLLPDFQAVTLNRVIKRPRVIAIPLLLAFLISGIVCYLLARYLTSPIKQLRLATNKIAAGDLAARVLPIFGNRKDEIVDLASDFDQMAEQLDILINSHKQLLSDASHELRSPLARLQVALGLARQRGPHDVGTELDRIERESERLNELIGQLLSVARLDAEFVNANKETIQLDKLLEDIAEDGAYEARSLDRSVAIIKNVPARLEGNRVLLQSALENVIRNAIRYTKKDTTVELSMVRLSDKPDWVEICIKDHGPGIPENMLTRIFEPFVRVGEARDRESGGYGLGLAIACRAIKLHGGTIVAHNQAGDGVVIQIHLSTAGTDSAKSL